MVGVRLALPFFALVVAQPALALTDAQAALLGAVGAQALGGKTSLGDHGGEIESWMSAAPLMGSAAQAIAKAISRDGVVLAADAESDLGLPSFVRFQTARFKRVLDSAPTKCAAKPSFTIKTMTESEGVVAPSLASVVAEVLNGAAKPTTQIDGQPISLDNQFMLNALQSAAGKHRWVILSDLRIPPAESALVLAWDNLRKKRDQLAQACPKDDAAKAAVAAYDAVDEKLGAPGDKGTPSLLERAALIDQALGSADQRLLQVRIEKVGGTVINTDTIITRLFAPAVRITGGLVMSYRLTDPKTGTSEKAGVVVCGAPKRPIGDVQRVASLNADSTQCKLVTQWPQA